MNAILDTLTQLVKPGQELVLSMRGTDTNTAVEHDDNEDPNAARHTQPNGMAEALNPDKPFKMFSLSPTQEQVDVEAQQAGDRFIYEDREWLLGKPIHLLPEGTFYHPLYGMKRFTFERHQRYVRLFEENPMGQLHAINIDHDTANTIGAIYSLEAREGEGLFATPMWLPRGEEMMAAGELWYSSAEIAGHWQRPSDREVFEDMIVGMAMTNHPFFTGEITGSLAGLAQQSSGLEAFGLQPGVPVPDTVEQVFTKLGNTSNVDGEGEGSSNENESDTQEEKEYNMTVMVETPPQVEQHASGAEEPVTITQEQFDQLMAGVKAAQAAEDRIAAAEALISQQQSELETERNARVAAEERRDRSSMWNKVAAWTGEAKDNVDLMLSLKSALSGEAEAEIFTKVFDKFDTLHKQLAASEGFFERGTQATPTKETNKIADFRKEAKELAKSEGISHNDAFARVMRDNKDAYNSYVAEARQRSKLGEVDEDFLAQS